MPKKKNYLIYNEGNIPLILSAPHTGTISPIHIPDRTEGVLVRDTYTKEILKNLVRYFDYHPYYIYSGIHRKKVDLNRDWKEATQGNGIAMTIWKTWHNIIGSFLEDSIKEFGRVLYIDLHSHNNADEFHLGYGLNKYEYRRLIYGEYVRKSSLFGLNPDERMADYDMIFRKGSFEDLLKGKGYKVHYPFTSEIYFGGGYNIERYSVNNVGAVQIEIPVSVAGQDVGKLSEDLGECINEFLAEFVMR
jgi:hypothetical protein